MNFDDEIIPATYDGEEILVSDWLPEGVAREEITPEIMQQHVTLCLREWLVSEKAILTAEEFDSLKITVLFSDNKAPLYPKSRDDRDGHLDVTYMGPRRLLYAIWRYGYNPAEQDPLFVQNLREDFGYPPEGSSKPGPQS